MRVWILARENVLHWAPLYIEAFRGLGEVYTTGPALDRERIAELGWQGVLAEAEPNDHVSGDMDVAALAKALPEGWVPDLVVAIQSGNAVFENLACLARPTLRLSIDTWHAPDELAFARAYDFVFCAQKVFVPYFRAGGSRWVQWLPLACSPAQHRPVPVPEDYDIVFVGSLQYVVNEQRLLRLGRLAETFNVAQLSGVGAKAMSEAFCRARVAFNSSIAQDVNMRVFEAMALGRPLLTNRDAEVNGLFDLFEEGTHLAAYDDGDLIATARALLEDEAKRRTMAQTARAKVLAHHTYGHRVAALLDAVRNAVPSFGHIDGPLLRDSDRLYDYIPLGAPTILDIGLGLEHSKHALRGLGVKRLLGATADEAQAARRAGSYDELVPYLPSLDSPVDALLWTCPLDYAPGLEQVLAVATDLLTEGGTLVLRLSRSEWDRVNVPSQFKAWDEWAFPRGFCLLRLREPRPDESWWCLSMRRHTRTVRAMSEEIYRRFPGGRLSS